MILVRHGETAWNHDRRLQGQTDVELNDLGREQARLLGAWLGKRSIDAVYSSDLRRCWETVTIATAGMNLTPVPVAELREINLGEWQGKTMSELRETRPHDVARVAADPINEAPPGGETRRQLQQRVVAAYDQVVRKHPEGRVLVVSHGGALRALACWLLQADLRASHRLELDNCGLVHLDVTSDRPLLRRWNDVAHLAGLIDPATRLPHVE